MKREKILMWFVAALFLLNIGTLSFLWLHKPPRPAGLPPKQLERLIVEKLALKPEQQKVFEALKKTHHEQMHQLDAEYAAGLGHYFSLLAKDSVFPTEKDSLENILVRIQQLRAQTTFQHFEDLKALSSPENRGNFKALLPDLMQVVLPHMPERPGPGNKNERQ